MKRIGNFRFWRTAVAEPYFARKLFSGKPAMEILQTPTRHRAIAMEFVAFLDEHCVEMRILTDAGEALTITCPSRSILEIQRQIDRLGLQCPEIATWNPLLEAA